MVKSTKKNLIVLILLSLSLPFILQLYSHVIQNNALISQLAYISSKLLFIIVPLLFWVITRKSPEEPHGKFRKLSIYSGIFIAVTIYFVLQTSIELIKPYGLTISQTLSTLGLTKNFILYSIVIIVFNSLLEELYWRYAIFGGLKEYVSVKLAIVVSSLGFAGMHLLYYIGLFDSVEVIVLLTTVTFLAGIFWAWLYQQTRSIKYVWINHMLVNIPLFYIEYLLILGH